MGAISGVPTTRVTDQFIRQRLMQQVQYSQRELYRLQVQMSTGYQYEFPSEKPIASLRVISLQRLLEQKAQVKTNLATSQSFLDASDAALSRVSQIVAEARGTALGVLGTTSTQEQRAAAAQQIRHALQQLADAGNQNFRGRYLFAGSQTETRPFSTVGNGRIRYDGNETVLQSYSDVDLLFDTNIPGSRVFGALSGEVVGKADLTPALTFDTPLSQLHNGDGVSLGSIAISDGTQTAVVDLSGAHTIGDVALMIKRQAAGLALNVEVGQRGLILRLASSAGDLSVREVGHGVTARQLGILTPIGVGTGPIVGEDLDPRIVPGTLLADTLGTYARAVIRFPGTDNDFFVQAVRHGTEWNDVRIRLEDDPAVHWGEEVVTYDAIAKEIVVRIDEGHSQAGHVVDAINLANDAGVLPFRASLDPTDRDAYPGQGLVAPTDPGLWAGITQGGSGQDLDIKSGIQVVNGGETFTISLADAVTVEDVLNRLNTSGAGLLAEINSNGTGINVRSRISGADFAIGENGGTTAAQLGIRSFDTGVFLQDLNYGRGVQDYQSEGQKSTAVWDSSGLNNALKLTAREAGPDWNGYRLRFYDAGLPPGSEILTFDQINKEIAVGIAPGYTTAQRVVDLFAASPGARDYFTLELYNEQDVPNDGTGLVKLGETLTSGGSSGGIDFLIQRADGVTLEIDVQGASTIQDVLDRINHHPDNPPRSPGSDPWLIARLSRFGNGIELVDDSIGPGTLTVSRSRMSRAAIDLGLIPEGAESATVSSPGSIAVAEAASPGLNNDLIFRTRRPTSAGNGFRVVFEDAGTDPESFSFDPANRVLRFRIQPGITTANRIIELFQEHPTAPQTFEVVLDPADGNDGSGFVDLTNPTAPPTLTGGSPSYLTGRDVNPLETEGLFTALIRLAAALDRNDVPEVQRAVEMLDRADVATNFVRAEFGTKQQALDILKTRLDDEDTQLRQVLSNDYEVDLVEVVSEFTGRQAALQAALKASAQIYQLSLLNYL
ncbi:MAG: flagellin N-terminal helical domain-containing protein [Thermogutta sp.]